MISAVMRVPEKIDLKSFCDDLAKQIEGEGVALGRGFLDEETSGLLELWWKNTKLRIQSGARQSVQTSVSTGSSGSATEDKIFDNLHQHPRILALARAYLGEDVCHLFSRLLLKDSSVAGPVECHQDWPYFVGNTSKLGIMVPLTLHTEENGKLYYVLNSHHFGPLPCGNIDFAKYPELKSFGPDLNLGDILAHDFLTWHYSVPSKNQQDRAVIQIVYQPSTDASSKRLINGRMRNSFSCPNPASVMARIDAPALYSLDILRSRWKSGNKEARETASKVCTGLILQKNSSSMSARATLAEIAIEDGRIEEARKQLTLLKEEYIQLRTTIDQLSREVAQHETEITNLALSGIIPLGQGRINVRHDGVALVSDPRQWAYSAEATFDVPGIESERRTVRIELEVESGVLGIGWLIEDGSAWAARASATPGATAVDLVIPAQTRCGKLIFENWTEGGEPAFGIIRSMKIIAARSSKEASG
jgi:Phytanoyl-CoA dioxygenase (PhyH)